MLQVIALGVLAVGAALWGFIGFWRLRDLCEAIRDRQEDMDNKLICATEVCRSFRISAIECGVNGEEQIAGLKERMHKAEATAEKQAQSLRHVDAEIERLKRAVGQIQEAREG